MVNLRPQNDWVSRIADAKVLMGRARDLVPKPL